MLFHKSKWGDGHILDNIISVVTYVFEVVKSGFRKWKTPDADHVEVWLPYAGSKGSTFSTPADEYQNGFLSGKMFSSTMRGKAKGTRFTDADGFIKHPNRWFWYEFECAEPDFDIAMAWALNEVANNKGYGKRTTLKFIGINWIDKLRNICSQVAHKFAVLCENMEQPPRIPSPRRLAAMCEAMGLTRHELKGI
jgi:hypothetical protein